jgi:hypothetical protein
MVRIGRMTSGVEEWLCSKCGCRMLLRWPPPRFEVIVLIEGDSSAVHSGTRSSPEAAQRAGTGEAGVSDDELQWLRSHGIDWGGPAN